MQVTADVELSAADIALRLAVALVGAAVIGWERESRNRPAGLRTHMLVALGSCVFTILAVDVYDQHRQSGAEGSIDPIRGIEGVIGGVGFLGAGAIMQSRGRVRGLTTAAGIWVVAAIGAAAGVGHHLTASVTVGLAFVTLFALGKFEKRLARSSGDGAPSSESSPPSARDDGD